MDFLLEPLQSGIGRRALLEVLLLSVVCGPLGFWVMSYRLPYATESLAHGMLPGLVGAALIGAPLLLGAAVLVVGLSACSDDDDGSASGTATTLPAASVAVVPASTATSSASASVPAIGTGGLTADTTLAGAPAVAVTSDAAGAASAPAPTPVPAGAAQVAIADLAFQPDVLTVAPGQPLVFTNADTRAHSVASATSEVLQSDTLAPGAQFTVTFDEAGTYDYFCGIHSHMSGMVEVSP